MYTKTLPFEINGIRLSAVFERALSASGDKPESKNYHSLHDHINFELFFIINGKIEIITEGESTVFKGSLLMIPPRYRHFTAIHGEILPFFISFSKHNSEEHLSLIEKKLNNGKINEMPMTPSLISHIGGLSSCLNSKKECADQRAKAYLELIFSDIFEYFGILGNQKAENNKEHAYFSIIEAFINKHYSDGCGLNELSEQLHLSVRQTSRVVKKLFGSSFSSVISDKRLAIASVMLKNTDKPISLISSELGYSHESGFFVSFKKKYGLTPLQYRKLFQR